MSCKFNPLYYMIVLLVLLLTACASAPQSTPLAVEFAPETNEVPAVKVEEQTTETAVPPTATSLPPTETAVATPTIEATATLTPYQVWEATCLTEGAEYVDVPFGTQEDGGMGIQALSQVIDGSLFSQDLIPDCYMFGADVTSPMVQERAVAWQLVPETAEAPGNLEIPNLTLPQGTYSLLLNNAGGEQIQIQPTPEPILFRLLSPFQGCSGDNNPVVRSEGSFNAPYIYDCMGSGYYNEDLGINQGWGHTDVHPPITCLEEGRGIYSAVGTIVAPASGTIASFECSDGGCYRFDIDNAEYIEGLPEALEFAGMPRQDIPDFISKITSPTRSVGGVWIQFGHVNLKTGHVDAGEVIGETIPAPTGITSIASYHVFAGDGSSGMMVEGAYQLSPQLFPLEDDLEWEFFPLDSWLHDGSHIGPRPPVSNYYPATCKGIEK